MAPLMHVDDGDDDLDFITTLSDRDEISDEEASDEPAVSAKSSATKPPSTKRKRDDAAAAAASDPPPKSAKKARKNATVTNGSAAAAKTEEAVRTERGDGEPGEKDSDVDSEFEFGLEDGTVALEDFEGWAGNADLVAPGGRGGRGEGKMVDVDAIVARRLGRKSGAAVEVGEADEEDRNEEDEDEEGSDGFGAGADLGEDEEGEEEDIGSEDGDEDEEGEDVEEKGDGSGDEPEADDAASRASADDEEDTVEQEKRNAFFAPEAKASAASQGEATFHSLSLSRPILKGLAEMRFSIPTPIQAKTIPVALEGKDVVGGAVTGSGKTAAFVIPILERLLFRPKRTATTRVVILMPTRELALQCFNVARKLASHTDITFGQAIGGLNSREQEKQLKLRPDIVIATPGRFIDLERNSSSFAVNTIEILVLDEADRMLEEGFADELNEILTKIPKSRQTMLFSATMTSKVDDLIRVGLQRPVRIMVDAQRSTVSGLVQEFIRLRPGRDTKRLGYLMHLCTEVYHDRVIVFFRQKKEAHRVRILFALSGVSAAELHGSMSQQQRIDAIEAFRTGRAAFLLATDLASRGLDIKGIDTVINYEAPQSHEIYLHRVGRTARAGRTGRACTLAAEPDRRVVKAAVKAAQAQGAVIRQRTVAPADADAWQARCDAWADEVEAVLAEEREEKALASTERDLVRADNIVAHEAEIRARPKKTWFESEKDKAAAKSKGLTALNGALMAGGERREKGSGKLSNKQKKKLLDRDERKAGLEWKKGKGERGKKGPSASGGGASKAKKGGKPKGGKPARKPGHK